MGNMGGGMGRGGAGYNNPMVGAGFNGGMNGGFNNNNMMGGNQGRRFSNQEGGYQ